MMISTKLTMIWNDCNCDGVSDHHWHTMEFPASHDQLRALDRTALIRLIMIEYYTKDQGKITAGDVTVDELVSEAMEDYGLVGVLLGEPEEL